MILLEYSEMVMVAACVGLGFLVALTFLFYRNRLRRAEGIVREAKREAMEAATLSFNTPYPLIHLARNGKIIFANPAALSAFPDVAKAGAAHPVLSHLDEFWNAEKVSSIREIAHNGVSYHQTVAVAETFGERSLILYAYNITPLKIIQTELEKSRLLAENANQAKSDFLANMSHELRTPMNGIIGLSELLAEADIDGGSAELAAAIHSSSRNLLILLNDILDFSKIEAGELTLESIPLSLERLIHQTRSLQAPMASRKGLIFKASSALDVPRFIKGDPVRLQQILNNLVGNAIKFTEEGSVTLNLSGTYESDHRFMLQIDVADTGIGIPLSQQDKIFTKFTQADISTARKYGGTGLGLSITKHLTGLMGGSIFLTSKEGYGTTFTVRIPFDVIINHVVEEEKKPLNAPATNFKGRVLLVDDHPVNLLFMRQTLQRLGLHEFDEAISGAEALKLALQNSYDLILMDCQMPEMDGLEATRRIRGQEGVSRNSTIVALTADAMKGSAERCFDAGMNDYISKPVSRKELVRVLEATLKKEIVAAMHNTAPKHLVFNRQRLEEFTEGDEAAIEAIMESFLENAASDVQALEEAFEMKRFDVWEAAAHKLYGSSVNVGADALAFACDKIHEENFDHKKIPALHESIMAAYKTLSHYVEMKKAA